MHVPTVLACGVVLEESWGSVQCLLIHVEQIVLRQVSVDISSSVHPHPDRLTDVCGKASR